MKLLLHFILEQGVYECSMNMVGYKAQLVFAGKDRDKARYALCFIIITLEVLRSQPIQLVQVVVASEFHEH